MDVTKTSGLLRLVITFLVNKLNIVKTLKSWKTVVRFTAACSLFSMIYHLVRRVARKHKLNKDAEVTLAAGIASLGLNLATPGDMGIFKVLLFSRAIQIATKLLGNETNLFQPVEDLTIERRTFTVEAIMCCSFCGFVGWAYIFLPTCMDTGFFNGFAKLCDFHKNEKMYIDSLRAATALRDIGLK